MGAGASGGVMANSEPFPTARDGRMMKLLRIDDQARRESAADWVVRIEAADLPEDEAAAFDTWLCADPDNATAFDEALAMSQSIAALAPAINRDLTTRLSARPINRRVFVGAGGLAAAAAAALVAGPLLTTPQIATYATSRGERRTVRLDDGSVVDLNGATRMTVEFRRGRRDVTLHTGQAVFDVAHDTHRPFFVAAGDRTVRVVGTQFDVRWLDRKVSVTVARGAVEVRPSLGAGPTYRLHPGQRLEHQEGQSVSQVAAAEPAEVLGWRTGRLVYRGQSLSEVVADLNQQFETPIRIDDPALAQAPVSGVLMVDDQDAVIRRLALLLPITAVRSASSVVLRRDPASDR